MSGSFFLDTNILVYAIDPTDPRKNAISVDWVKRANESGLGMISHQVVYEWFSIVLRRSPVQLQIEDAVQAYRTAIEPLWRVDSSRSIVNAALTLFRDHSFSWWDALIVSAAIEAKCSVLLSEDLQHGREIGTLRIENPFL